MKKSILLFLRKLLYIKTYFFWQLFPHRGFSAFILCYHSIYNDDWNYSLDEEVFEKQLQYLTAHYQTGTLSDIIAIINRGKKFSRPVFVITFDDGYKDIYKLSPILLKYNIHPTVFILADNDKKINRREMATDRPLLSVREIKNLIKAGWTIGSHGMTHCDFKSLSPAAYLREISQSKKILEKKYSVPIHYFAYPKGRYDKTVTLFTRRAGYTLGLSMDDGLITSKTNLFAVPRAGVVRNMSFPEFRSVFLPYSVIIRKLLVKRLGLII